jgi:hypothetical protein
MAVAVDKIKELLGNGLSNEVVATAVGVHPSYISQLMADEQFSSEVVSRRTTSLAAHTLRDRSWDGIEDSLLRKLGELVENQMIYKTHDVLQAIRVVNGARRRGVSTQDSLVVNNNVVNLVMPTVVLNSYKKNSHGEVVEVSTPSGQTQTLVTMPASALMAKLSEQHQGPENRKEYEQIRNYLPEGDGEKKES